MRLCPAPSLFIASEIESVTLRGEIETVTLQQLGITVLRLSSSEIEDRRLATDRPEGELGGG